MKLIKCYLLLLILVFSFNSCDGSGTTAEVEDPDTVTDEIYELEGSLGGSAVKMKLSVDDSSGAARLASNVKTLSGFLVYDDMTLNCSGTYNSSSGLFVVSASGSFGGIELKFSLQGKITNGVVTQAEIMLTVFENDVLTGTYGCEMIKSEAAVEKTDKVCDDTSVDYPFEGRWMMEDSDVNSYALLVFTDNSFTYTIYENGIFEIFNGTLLEIEVSGSNSNDYNIVMIIDENLLEGESEIEIYEVLYLKGRVEGSNALYFVDPWSTVDTLYFLTNYNLELLMDGVTSVPDAKYPGGYQIDSVGLDMYGDPDLGTYVQDILTTTLISKAEALDYNVTLVDHIAKFIPE